MEVLDDLRWDNQEKVWLLRLRLRARTDGGGSSIPEWTEWFMHVESTYPYGEVELWPSKHGGIAESHQHQQLNRPGSGATPWREGKLCLLADQTRDPDWRLLSYALRGIDWIEAASRGQLIRDGEPFDLPAVPFQGQDQIGFREDARSLDAWARAGETEGWADCALAGAPHLSAVTAFRTLRRRLVMSVPWGDLVRRSPRRGTRTAWWRLREMPILPPYAPPTTWRELAQATRRGGLDLAGALQRIAPELMDGRRHRCLLGFPIPERQGGTPTRMHWWAIQIPALAFGDHAARGFRRGEAGYWRADFTRLFLRDCPVDWISTDNWHPRELRSRGALPETLRDRRILLIGAGALGSALAEMLVRGGVSRLRIVDPDRFTAGNGVRHTLGFGSVRSYKAERLAERLRALNPDLEVHSTIRPFRGPEEPVHGDERESDIVIDCTAADGVIDELGRMPSTAPRLFFSVSFGFGARRLMCFSAWGLRFPTGAYWQSVGPWLQREREERADVELPRAGVGCWDPAFPGRSDDIWLVAAVAMKSLERAVGATALSCFEVYEREDGPDGFCGVKRVAIPQENAGH